MSYSSEYYAFCRANLDALQVSFARCINDTTLEETYFYRTNVMFSDNGYYIGSRVVSVACTKSNFKLYIRNFRDVFQRKIKLIGTDNSMGYTRLIYGF